VFTPTDVDVVMLDADLPDESGLSVLRDIRSRSEVGVIMVGARVTDVDRIVAFELGADDYVSKPYNLRELLPRAKNLARRVAAARDAAEDAPRRSFAGWTIDVAHWTLTAPDGADVRLTRAEFELLAAFVTHPGRVMTRDNLIDHVAHRGRDPLDRTVDVLVGRLRRKIEVDPKRPRLIVTVHGVGYVFAG
jgi:two-component system torCAD operon response regulator TorR